MSAKPILSSNPKLYASTRKSFDFDILPHNPSYQTNYRPPNTPISVKSLHIKGDNNSVKYPWAFVERIAEKPNEESAVATGQIYEDKDNPGDGEKKNYRMIFNIGLRPAMLSKWFRSGNTTKQRDNRLLLKALCLETCSGLTDGKSIKTTKLEEQAEESGNLEQVSNYFALTLRNVGASPGLTSENHQYTVDEFNDPGEALNIQKPDDTQLMTISVPLGKAYKFIQRLAKLDKKGNGLTITAQALIPTLMSLVHFGKDPKQQGDIKYLWRAEGNNLSPFQQLGMKFAVMFNLDKLLKHALDA